VIAAQLLTAPWPADGFARFLIVTSTGVVLASSVLTPATIVTNRLPAAGTYSVVIDPPGITT
jgi:hypothetical protein